MNLDKPIVFIDLEATGISIQEDRIVEIALLKRTPEDKEEFFGSLVNPRVPIPPDSAAIHHITDEMIRKSPTFAELALPILKFLDDCDLGGFGILKFDVPLLRAEFQRAGFFLPLDNRRLVDALAIYHKMEPRNLGAAYRFYCGKSLDGAHRAEADTRAAGEVFWAQLERYPDLPKDMDALSAWCRMRGPAPAANRRSPA